MLSCQRGGRINGVPSFYETINSLGQKEYCGNDLSFLLLRVKYDIKYTVFIEFTVIYGPN